MDGPPKKLETPENADMASVFHRRIPDRRDTYGRFHSILDSESDKKNRFSPEPKTLTRY
jgi:hypothetical protein